MEVIIFLILGLFVLAIAWAILKNTWSLTSAVNNGEKHLVDFIRQPDGKSLGILGQVT